MLRINSYIFYNIKKYLTCLVSAKFGAGLIPHWTIAKTISTNQSTGRLGAGIQRASYSDIFVRETAYSATRPSHRVCGSIENCVKRAFG